MLSIDPFARTDKGIGKIVDIMHRHYGRHDKREANNIANPMISLRLLPSHWYVINIYTLLQRGLLTSSIDIG